MSDLPTTIAGGVRYDREPLGGKPTTGRFIVMWQTLSSSPDEAPAWFFVSSKPFWVGDRRSIDRAHLRFPEAVARHMLSHPPL